MTRALWPLRRAGSRLLTLISKFGDDLALVESAEQNQRLKFLKMKLMIQFFLVTNITRINVTIHMLTKRRVKIL